MLNALNGVSCSAPSLLIKIYWVVIFIFFISGNKIIACILFVFTGFFPVPYLIAKDKDLFVQSLGFSNFNVATANKVVFPVLLYLLRFFAFAKSRLSLHCAGCAVRTSKDLIDLSLKSISISRTV